MTVSPCGAKEGKEGEKLELPKAELEAKFSVEISFLSNETPTWTKQSMRAKKKSVNLKKKLSRCQKDKEKLAKAFRNFDTSHFKSF